MKMIKLFLMFSGIFAQCIAQQVSQAIMVASGITLFELFGGIAVIILIIHNILYLDSFLSTPKFGRITKLIKYGTWNDFKEFIGECVEHSIYCMIYLLIPLMMILYTIQILIKSNVNN